MQSHEPLRQGEFSAGKQSIGRQCSLMAAAITLQHPRTAFKTAIGGITTIVATKTFRKAPHQEGFLALFFGSVITYKLK